MRLIPLVSISFQEPQVDDCNRANRANRTGRDHGRYTVARRMLFVVSVDHCKVHGGWVQSSLAMPVYLADAPCGMVIGRGGSGTNAAQYLESEPQSPPRHACGEGVERAAWDPTRWMRLSVVHLPFVLSFVDCWDASWGRIGFVGR